MNMCYIRSDVFRTVEAASLPIGVRLPLIAKMCRLNTLFEVKRAGSGHLGSSFSAMDIVVYLYYHYLNLRSVGIEHPDRDIYFSSKGHDVPGFYAVLYSLGIIPEERFLRLRRLGGLDGHPDVGVPGVEANTGSLGMGISKGRGMLWAKRKLGRGGKVIVMTGDGEFQEGQNFEALQSTVQQKMNDLTVIMDHNTLQSDRPVEKIVDLGNLVEKFRAFGWHAERCDGHDIAAFEKTFKTLESVTGRPKIVVLDTIKGKGISFMEHPQALRDGGGFYQWHAGAPDDVSFAKGFAELRSSLEHDFASLGLGMLPFTECSPEAKKGAAMSGEVVSVAYGKALYELAQKDTSFVLLDADLSADCKIKDFERDFAERFIECGIAEQDMTSMAAGVAAQGITPIVHTFANFLAARANEQIYNNSTEHRKIIYACHYAGLIPAGPGKSHQSIRDISLFAALPHCTIIQAANATEMREAVRYAVTEAKESVMLRINIGPSPRVIQLPNDYAFLPGHGAVLTEGKELVLMAYGPVMLHEALVAADLLAEKGHKLQVINMPWLNHFDAAWIQKTLAGCTHLFFLEDHAPTGGLSDQFMRFLNSEKKLCDFRMQTFGVEGFPACGTPDEALRFHGLDGASLAARIQETVAA